MFSRRSAQSPARSAQSLTCPRPGRAGRTSTALALLGLGLYGISLAGAGCAAPRVRPTSDSGVTDALLQQRGKALEALAVTALRPCADKLLPEDSGVLVVLGKPDGSVDLGPLQWSGNAASQKCITDEAVKARLPPYNGPTVTWLWSIGTAAHPAPGPLTAPAGYRERLAEQTQTVQGPGSSGVSPAQNVLSSCPIRSLAPDAFASLIARLFIFPDGHVAGVTPVSAAYEAKEPVFLDCAMDLMRGWQFPAFTGPGFVVIDAPLKRGIDPSVH